MTDVRQHEFRWCVTVRKPPALSPARITRDIPQDVRSQRRTMLTSAGAPPSLAGSV